MDAGFASARRVLGAALLGAGRSDEAVAELTTVAVEPRLEPLRRDPRFDALLQQLRLPR
jgi:hypothetical protein